MFWFYTPYDRGGMIRIATGSPFWCRGRFSRLDPSTVKIDLLLRRKWALVADDQYNFETQQKISVLATTFFRLKRFLVLLTLLGGKWAHGHHLPRPDQSHLRPGKDGYICTTFLRVKRLLDLKILGEETEHTDDDFVFLVDLDPNDAPNPFRSRHDRQANRLLNAFSPSHS
jgi:hypothetical protein